MSATLAWLVALTVFPGGVFALAVGLWLKGFDRRLIARLQQRVGPPLLQPLYDLSKLLRKRTLIPEEAHPAIFLGAPAFGLATVAVACALLPVPGLYSPPRSDLVLFVYLLAVPGIVIMLSGSSSGSVYGAIGFSREMSLILAYEGPLLFALVAVAVYVGRAQGVWVELSLAEIVRFQTEHGPNIARPILWPAFFAYLAFLPATLGVAPFDIAEAETEVLEGPLLEYSGPPLAALQAMQAMTRFVALGLGVTLFFPFDAGSLAAVPVFVIEVTLLGAIAVTAIRASMGRMRIDQALRFFLTWPEAAGLLSLVLALLWT